MTSDQPGPLCLFTGAAASFNVRRLVANLAWMLTGQRTVHLVTTTPGSFDDQTRASVSTFGEERDSTIRGELAAISGYLRLHDPAALVQLTRPPVHGTLLGLLAANRDLPVVYRYGGDRFYSYKVGSGVTRIVHFSLNNLLGRVPLSMATRCIVLGPTGRSRLTARGVDPDRVTILPPSIDVTQFSAEGPVADIPDVPEERHVALTVGRLSRRKGIETMDRVVPSILDNRDDIQFVFVGRTDRAPDIPEEWRSHVTVVGPVPPAEVPGYYRRASLLVHPSLNEGLPRVVLEALATETPVVARDVGEVATATRNTFTADSELVELVSEFERLATDDVRPFTRERLRSDYLSFFSQFG